jgi:hypothetical protein
MILLHRSYWNNKLASLLFSLNLISYLPTSKAYKKQNSSKKFSIFLNFFVNTL